MKKNKQKVAVSINLKKFLKFCFNTSWSILKVAFKAGALTVSIFKLIKYIRALYT